MPIWVHIVVAVSVFILIVFSIRVAFEFRSYCEATAKFEARTAEFEKISSDENSLNSYEREQFKLLMNGQFSKSVDQGLAAWGGSLARRLKFLRNLTFICIVVVGIIYIGSEVFAKI